MNIIASFLLIICALSLVYLLYILKRNYEVHSFRSYIIDRLHEAKIRAINKGIFYLDEYDDIYDKYSYNDMLYSFKPLKLEYWFTQEEIDLMNKFK